MINVLGVVLVLSGLCLAYLSGELKGFEKGWGDSDKIIDGYKKVAIRAVELLEDEMKEDGIEDTESFDVDKVVEKLNMCSFTYHVEESDGMGNSRRAVDLDTAIRIVKGGGNIDGI